jgi:hypothetical protein
LLAEHTGSLGVLLDMEVEQLLAFWDTAHTLWPSEE